MTNNDRLVEWFGQWRKPIRSWLRDQRAVPSGDIDDLAQEVFLRLLRYSDNVTVENPASYLFRIASNVASEWRQRVRNRDPHDDSWLDELQIDADDEPESAIEREQYNAFVKSVVDRLPPRRREILLLHVNDELTYQQIADLKGLTYRIVLRQLTRAYAQLRKGLCNECFGEQP